MKSSAWATSSQTLHQAFKFGVVGVSNTLVGLGTIYALMAWAGLNPFIANGIGYAIALVNSYVLNKLWTFRDRGRVRGQVARFLGVFGISYGLQLALLWLLITPMQVNPYISQVVAMIAYTGVNFVGNKLFTFNVGARPRIEAADEDIVI